MKKEKHFEGRLRSSVKQSKEGKGRIISAEELEEISQDTERNAEIALWDTLSMDGLSGE